MALSCPECGQNFDGGKRDPTFGLSQHLAKKDDHAPESYPEAKEEAQAAAKRQSGETGDTEPEASDSGSKEETNGEASENPLMETPEGSGSQNNNMSDECPNCGSDETESVPNGKVVKAVRKGSPRKAVSSGSETYCNDCEHISHGGNSYQVLTGEY